jgi:hypothetical protein
VAFPIKTCSLCGEEFELKPGKPGFANQCPECSAREASESPSPGKSSAHFKNDREANQARRDAMRNLLYRKDS